MAAPSKRPLDSERWAGAIDNVGGDTLAGLLRSVAVGGSVASCGLAGGAALNGNVRQWLVSSFRRLDDERNRPAEFSQRQLIPASELLAALGNTLTEASDVLASLTEADLLMTLQIQGYTVSGLRAVYQVVEHFAMHYGQILYVTKLLRSEDLGFYRELDRTGRLPPKQA